MTVTPTIWRDLTPTSIKGYLLVEDIPGSYILTEDSGRIIIAETDIGMSTVWRDV